LVEIRRPRDRDLEVAQGKKKKAERAFGTKRGT